jgi:Zn-dependent protease
LLLVLVAFIVLAVISFAVPGGRMMVQEPSIGANQGVSSGLQAAILLCTLAILINLSLCFFNLLPIPPLDGSRVLRNMLPYGAAQAYDRVPIWASYLLMIFVGRYVLMALLSPALALIYTALSHF